MPQIIGIVVIIIMIGVGIFVMGYSDEPKEIKTEKQMILQDTESTNSKLSNR